MFQALINQPLFWLAVTFALFLLSEFLQFRCHGSILLNPLLLTTVILVVLLLVLHIPYKQYFAAVQIVHFMLPISTVALALPLFMNLKHIKPVLVPMLVSLLIGSIAGIVSVIWLGKLFNLSPTTIISLLPKSVTTPIAMVISEHSGGNAGLTANVVIITGIFGAVTASFLCNLIRVKNLKAQGFAIGISSHGIGTAQAMQMSSKTGVFSGLAMSLNGIITPLLIPVIIYLYPVF